VHHLLPDIYIVEEKLWIRRGQKGLRRCVFARGERREVFFIKCLFEFKYFKYS
jgi:hypothetical protein